MPEIVTDAPAAVERAVSWKLLAAALLSASAVFLFGLDQAIIGYLALAASLIAAALVDRRLFKDLALIAAGLIIISSVPLNADLSIGHMALMGGALALAVAVPYLVSRYLYLDHAVRFPLNLRQRWSVLERWYLVIVVALCYAILPAYLISTGVYQNWPDTTSDPSLFVRLFLGVNGVGIWDELFFICTAFTLLRRHFSVWQANLLQAVIFASFLWEIGYQAWGPLLTVPFALLQGYMFARTRSLTYVLCVHLLFDLVLFLALVHAHNRDWLPIFFY